MAGATVGRKLDYQLLEQSEGGVQVREQHLLQSLRSNTGPEYIVLKPERLQPSTLTEPVFEREELELRSTVSGDDLEPRICHGLELCATGRERDVVAREGLTSVLDAEVVAAEPKGHLAPSEPLFSIYSPVFEPCVTQSVQLPRVNLVEKNACSRSWGW